MVDWSNWISWSFGEAITYTIVAIGIWLVGLTKEAKESNIIKHPKLLGAAAALTSCFSLGLLAVVPLGLFLIFSWLLETWHKKLSS